jgi:hypothetical protein
LANRDKQQSFNGLLDASNPKTSQNGIIGYSESSHRHEKEEKQKEKRGPFQMHIQRIECIRVQAL